MPTEPRSVHDERDLATVPTAGARWVAVLVLIGLVATAGIGDRLVRHHTVDRATGVAVALKDHEGTPGADLGPVEVGRGSSVGHDTLRSSAEYIAEAAAICDTATVRLRAATVGLSSARDHAVWDAAIDFSQRALADLRTLPLPKRQGQRIRFTEFRALLRRQTDTLRRMAAAAANGHTAHAGELRIELAHLIDTADRREPLLRSCPVDIGLGATSTALSLPRPEGRGMTA